GTRAAASAVPAPAEFPIGQKVQMTTSPSITTALTVALALLAPRSRRRGDPPGRAVRATLPHLLGAPRRRTTPNPATGASRALARRKPGPNWTRTISCPWTGRRSHRAPRGRCANLTCRLLARPDRSATARRPAEPLSAADEFQPALDHSHAVELGSCSSTPPKTWKPRPRSRDRAPPQRGLRPAGRRHAGGPAVDLPREDHRATSPPSRPPPFRLGRRTTPAAEDAVRRSDRKHDEAPGIGLGLRSCSSGWTRTSNPSVNSRMLCQLSYGGMFSFVPPPSRADGEYFSAPLQGLSHHPPPTDHRARFRW